MSATMSERARGTGSVAETEQRREAPATIDDLNREFTDVIAKHGRSLMQLKGTTEQEAAAAMDGRREDYERAFRSFWQRQGMTVDQAAVDAAWQKVRRQATARYRQLMAAPSPLSRPAMPEAPAPAAAPERTFGDDPRWLQWGRKEYNTETLYGFNDAFLPALADALRHNTVERNVMKRFYQDTLFRMYLNTYSEIPASEHDATRRNVQTWLDARWDEVVAAARELPVT